jgi:hypothetical protein
MRDLAILILTISFSHAVIAQKIDKLPKNPDEKITVNKEFDENGNLIGYDSTYVHTWSSDSSMVFPFDTEEFFSLKGGFPDANKFMQKFFGDSAFADPFFGMDNDLMKHFGKHFLDSDSTLKDPFNEFFFNSDPFSRMDKNFGKEIEKLRKQMDKNNQWFALPDSIPGKNFYYYEEPSFRNEEQMKEYKALKEKQRKEMEEFRKKWDAKNQKESRKL